MALPSLLRVDLSRNFLNGPLSMTAGKLTQLEEVRVRYRVQRIHTVIKHSWLTLIGKINNVALNYRISRQMYTTSSLNHIVLIKYCIHKISLLLERCGIRYKVYGILLLSQQISYRYCMRYLIHSSLSFFQFMNIPI